MVVVNKKIIEDCGSTTGERVLASKDVFPLLLGAYYVNAEKKSVLITNELKETLLNTIVTVRKPHGCLFRLRGNSYIPCSKCYAGIKNTTHAFFKQRSDTF